MKAAIYARVSTRDRGQDTANQVEQLRQFAAANDYDIFREYIDQESGGRGDRPAFLALFEDARKRRFDVVLFWALDRFSREGASQTLNHLNWLTSHGVKWRSYTEQYIDSCGIFAEAVISILAVIAKQERIRLSERTKAGLEKARNSGKRLGRPSVDAELIRQLHENGFSCGAIAETLAVNRSTVARKLSSFR